ncbi:hypothetical protein JW835_08650 [bacterium]|nr:hypothetical protein [bacterium]
MSTNHFARFRFNAVERWIPLPIIFLFVFAAGNFNVREPLIFTFCILIAIYWIYRMICVWLFHYVIFNETGIIVRKGFFIIPHHFEFSQITNIHTIKPDRHINFQINEKHIIQLPLSRMKKEDRIRFIFLIESDVNRLSINGTS